MGWRVCGEGFRWRLEFPKIEGKVRNLRYHFGNTGVSEGRKEERMGRYFLKGGNRRIDQLGPPRTTRSRKDSMKRASEQEDNQVEEGHSSGLVAPHPSHDQNADSPPRKRSCVVAASQGGGVSGKRGRQAASSTPVRLPLPSKGCATVLSPRQARRKRVVEVVDKNLDVSALGWGSSGVSLTSREKGRLVLIVRNLLEKTTLSKGEVLDIVGLSEPTFNALYRQLEGWEARVAAGQVENGQNGRMSFEDAARGNRFPRVCSSLSEDAVN